MNEMNQLHYPDIERCKKLTELGFPNTELHWNDTLSDRPEIDREMYTLGGNPYVCPSVMEMWDVIPYKEIQVSIYTDMFGSGLNASDEDGNTFVSKKEPPNALADLIIWLVENGHLTFDKR